MAGLDKFRYARKHPGAAWAYGKARARVRLSRCLPAGYSLFPSTVVLWLTNRCNLRCKMCGFWGQDGQLAGRRASDLRSDEMEVTAFQQVINQVARFRPTIELFGGEPMLYSGWDQLVRQAKEYGLYCRMITNGTLLKDQAERIASSGLDFISVSLDGLAMVHDESRGVPGTFERIAAGLEKLKREENSRHIAIDVNCVITDMNFQELGRLLKSVGEMGVDSITFQHLSFMTHEEALKAHEDLFQAQFGCLNSHWRHFSYQPRNLDIERLLEQIEQLTESNSSVLVRFRPEFPSSEIRVYYRDVDYVRRAGAQCIAPWMSVKILPNGDVTPCMGFVVGNVQQEPLGRIWNNARYRRFRKLLKKQERFPACQRCCN